MEIEKQATLLKYFDALKDPKINRKKLYPLNEILLVVLCGTICGVESWRDFVIFGKEKIEFFRSILEFKNGIPGKNTFARVLAVIDPKEFKGCFIGQATIHMVSAFVSELRLVLGQEKVDEKSNEIKAISELLKLLNLTGATVSIDTMGCQTAIAEQIIAKGADYVLALKGKQGTLHDDVKLYLDDLVDRRLKNVSYDYAEEIEKGYGRIEKRKCWVTENIGWLSNKESWCHLKSISVLEAERQIGEKNTIERRFYISSLPAVAQRINGVIRQHWNIENALHWTLDVVFNEDYSRIRERSAAENMAIVRHVALNLLQLAKNVSYRFA